jgi:hypothetical protein
MGPQMLAYFKLIYTSRKDISDTIIRKAKEAGQDPSQQEEFINPVSHEDV